MTRLLLPTALATAIVTGVQPPPDAPFGRGSGWQVAMGAKTPAQTPTAAEIAQRLQQRQQTIKSFTARYTQEYTAPFLPQKKIASGTIKVLKPFRMWMAEDKPDVKLFVADGKYVWDYDVANKYAIRTVIPRDATDSTATMFLAGTVDLTRDFTSSLAPGAPAGEWHLVLTPKSANSEFATLTMMVARDTLKLTGLIKVDQDRQKYIYRFTNLQENAPLQMSQFELKLPGDVHIEIR